MRVHDEGNGVLTITDYIHDEPDEIPEWKLDENGGYKYPNRVMWFDPAYEIKIVYQINTVDYLWRWVSFDGIDLNDDDWKEL